MSNKIVFGNH